MARQRDARAKAAEQAPPSAEKLEPVVLIHHTVEGAGRTTVWCPAFAAPGGIGIGIRRARVPAG